MDRACGNGRERTKPGNAWTEECPEADSCPFFELLSEDVREEVGDVTKPP